ncbi:MAG: dockerin type I domain-containing protein [Pirellulaceae bacterium]|nr:dockerin type I domain-containing protein [Pirellulaceae bacterium]
MAAFDMSPFNRRKRDSRSVRRLRLEQLELRQMFAGLPFGAIEEDTGEFMLGRVAVTPIFLESNGRRDPNTETWTQANIQIVMDKIHEGHQWWVDTLAELNTVHKLEFVIDPTFATTPVETDYEPISRISNDYSFWVQEFLVGAGYGSNIQSGIRAFNHAQRVKFDADWSFSIFVVPSFNDADGQFAAGGSFSRAFAFAGGLFQVIPATRPASTFAHETGHMFWARDEYIGGGSFFQRRGYYNTPNTNAADNTTPGFVQQPSIMASGGLLDTAYLNNISPASTLAMIGWQDSDSDGIFDVLDVPLKLTGSGFYDAATSTYKFAGSATVQTLPNLNTDGFRNDITINRITDIQYRLDGGAWQTFSQPNVYVANLDLSIPVASNTTTIEIRARDSQSTVVSNVFSGRLSRADATQVPGINGFVWIDANKNNLRDAGEFGAAGWTVDVTGPNGEALNLRRKIEPDSYPDGQLASNFSSVVTLSAIGSDSDGRVGVFSDTANSTGNKNFRGFSRAAQSYLSTWTASTRRLQITFSSPTSVVEIDAIGAAASSFGRLEVYNTSGQLLGRYTTAELSDGGVEKMRIARGTADIAYAIASGHTIGNVRLDNLQFGAETQTVTGVRGQYSFPSLPPGSYRVQVTSPTSNPISPSGGRQLATVAANTATADIDFGFDSNTSQWQNTLNRFDVNRSSEVSPLDALLVINELNARGSRSLVGSNFVPPPFVDVNGDSSVSPIDVLLVINFLNARANGEGEFQGTPPLGGSGSVGGSDLGSGNSQGDSGLGGSGLVGSGEAYSELFCFAVEQESSGASQNLPEFSGFSTDPEGETEKKRREEADDDRIVELIELLALNQFA